MTGPLRYRWTWRFDVTPEQLWPYVADIDRFDRDIGLPQVRMVGKPGPDHRIRLRPEGSRLGREFVQDPYEWHFPERFSVAAVFPEGPLAELLIEAQLVRVGPTETELVYQVEATPRSGWLSRRLVSVQFGRVLRKRIDRTFSAYGRMAKSDGSRWVASSPPASFPAGGLQRLQALGRVLVGSGQDEDLVARLVELLASGDDVAVGQVRPYAMAAAWGRDRIEVLDLFMQATRAGVLDLSWDVLCPVCRVTKETTSTLADLPDAVHCETCNVSYEANFATSVELTFRPNPSIRRAGTSTYCLGGPMTTPHVVAQSQICAGGSATLPVDFEPGRYRLRIPGTPGSQLVRLEPGRAHSLEVTIDGRWADVELAVAPNGVVVIHNAGDTAELVLLERLGWAEHALIAAEVMSQQRFRDLFSGETLRPGQKVSVGTLTVLFTDLVGSTEHYRRVGDGVAFGQVLDHFEVIQDAVEEHGGAVVKTIGDAVMAVFQCPADALDAFDVARARVEAIEPGFQIKGGVHTGPAIAVTLNDRLDYFGTTVNLAARLDSLAKGGDLVVSRSVLADPQVRTRARDLRVSRFRASVKGFAGDQELYRIRFGGVRVDTDALLP